MTIDEQLLRDEGERLFPYLDCCGKPWRECVCAEKGKLTIGCGRNLDDNGISHVESEFMKGRDIMRVQAQLQETWPWTQVLDGARKGAMQNMAYNLGVRRLSAFHLFLEAMEQGDWKTAAKEMMNSKWAKQVGPRAERLRDQILTGVWQ